MTSDTPKRSGQPSHLHSDRARQSQTFASAASSQRSRSRHKSKIKSACFLGLLLLLTLAGFSALSKGRRSRHFLSRGLSDNDALRQIAQSASSELQNCTAASNSPVCNWAKKHSRANRKRPADWEPKEGWPEDAEVAASLRHASDRALAAVGNATSSVHTPVQALQTIVQSFWPNPAAHGSSGTQAASLPQCNAVQGHSCIAVIGNGNVLLPLQPDLQDCVIVREVELLTGASCEHSADVWLASQPLALSTLAALTSKNQQCSIQQVMSKTKAIWYLGGEQVHIQQLQSQDPSIANVPAIHFPYATWKEQYKARTAPASAGAAMEPSPLWIGLMTVLECALPGAHIHVFPSQSSSQTISLHDVAAEAAFLTKLQLSGLIWLHEDCLEGASCPARPSGITLQGNKGLAAPGVKLYPHRKKWQDSSMRVYNEEEEDEDETS